MSNNEEGDLTLLTKEDLIRQVQRLSKALDACDDVGLYPQSLSGAGYRSYEKRTDYMEGWNACYFAMSAAVLAALSTSSASHTPDQPVPVQPDSNSAS